jgi:hypothetical protein
MLLFEFKYVSAAIILITSVIGALGAVFVTALKWRARFESLAGGAFLFAGRIHLLPEASDDLEWLHDPLAPTITIAIFVIFTLINLFSVSESEAAGFNTPQATAYDSLPEFGELNCDVTDQPPGSESRFGYVTF